MGIENLCQIIFHRIATKSFEITRKNYVKSHVKLCQITLQTIATMSNEMTRKNCNNQGPPQRAFLYWPIIAQHR